MLVCGARLEEVNTIEVSTLVVGLKIDPLKENALLMSHNTSSGSFIWISISNDDLVMEIVYSFIFLVCFSVVTLVSHYRFSHEFPNV